MAHAGDVQARRDAAERLRKEKAEIAERLKRYEGIILQSGGEGGAALVEKARAREAEVKQRQQELERRRALAPHCV